MSDFKENYHALLVAIFCNCTPEHAFLKLNDPNIKDTRLTDEDAIDMLNLKKQGLSYKEIGKIYGITLDAVFKRVKDVRE